MVDGAPRSEPVDSILERLRDPFYLPATNELERAFTFMGDPNSANHATDFQTFLLQEYEDNVWEYPTKEFIRGLGDYVGNRIEELGGTPEAPVRILEVAAGWGRISHFLSERLEQTKPGSSETLAVDDFSWITRPRQGIGTQVKNMPYEAALRRYQPDIVIGAWLPSSDSARRRVDWSRKFRETPSVSEYILIGDPGLHALPATFGQAARRISEIVPLPEGVQPEYEKEGFKRTDLNHLSPHQFTQYDRKGLMHTSRTVAFSRVES